MRRRSSRAIALGLGALAGAWAFGSTPASVMGVGLVLAALLARGFTRVARGALDLERRAVPGERVEGADVVVEVSARHRRRLLGGSVVLRQRLGPAQREERLRGTRTLLTFAGLPRGRHRLEPLEAVLRDPLGLERVDERIAEPVEILLRPRVPVLGSVFCGRGTHEAGTARSGVRRPTGFEIHAVREYAPGEPLRAVHWPSTARRGRLMVKELEDAPRDDLAVILDQDADGVAGPPGSSSFDAAVRAAGALALAHVLWNRRVALVGTAPSWSTVRLRTPGSDWEAALDALAAVEPVPGADVGSVLRSLPSAVARAREIVVVTGRPERAADALLDLGRSGRSVSLVAVASETYAGRPRRAPDPAVLRAAAHGVPVAVVADGISLAEALGGRALGAVGA